MGRPRFVFTIHATDALLDWCQQLRLPQTAKDNHFGLLKKTAAHCHTADICDRPAVVCTVAFNPHSINATAGCLEEVWFPIILPLMEQITARS